MMGMPSVCGESPDTGVAKGLNSMSVVRERRENLPCSICSEDERHNFTDIYFFR